LILLGVPPLGATIILHRVARVCQRQLGYLVELSCAQTTDTERETRSHQSSHSILSEIMMKR